MSRKDEDLEWKNRVLCSDESCIGVIGPDGNCKECGLAYTGELPESFHQVPSEASNDHPAAMGPSTASETITGAATAGATMPPDDADDEWERRTLCIDESCIGVLGPDGCCKECGKPYPDGA